MENEEKITDQNSETAQSKTMSTGALTMLPAENFNFAIFPIEGKSVRKGKFKGRSYIVGHKIPDFSDFVEAYTKFYRLVNDSSSKVKPNDFQKYFDVVSFKDYTNPAYLCDFCRSANEIIPEEKIAPSTKITIPGEFIKNFVKIESGWYALVIANKSNPDQDTRAIYLSNGGFAICSNDIVSLRHGKVPELCYLIDSRDNPKGFIDLDNSYYDRDHRDFLNIYYGAALEHLQDLKGSIAKSYPYFDYLIDYDIEEVQKAYNNGLAEAQKRLGNY